MKPPAKPLPQVPSLAMLRAFDAFGRSGGIRKAAKLLEVDHAVVSRHLAALEAHVGTALVERGHGAGHLTPDGAEYHRSIAAAFQDIASATQRLRKRHDRQLLIWCSPGLAFHWLSQRLPGFEVLVPEIALELRPMDYGPDFSITEADADIRYVRHGLPIPRPPAYCRWLELASPPVYPVASPMFAAQNAAHLAGPRSLMDLRLLHEESDSEWRQWLSAQGLALDPAPLAGPRLWHAHMMIEAARGGQGVALVNDFLARGDLAEGRLVRLEGHETAFAPVRLGAYHFTARMDRWYDERLARFRNWLEREAAREMGEVVG